MTSKKHWAIAVATVTAMALAVVAAAAVAVRSSALPAVQPEVIAVDAPDVVPELRGKGLQMDYRVDGMDFAGARTGERQPGELIIDWYADGGLSFRQEIWVLGSPFEAWRNYYSKSPRPGYEREFGDFVAGVKAPISLIADSYSYFCGNVGNSRTDDFEDCQVWGYWARYGQYLIYVELRGAPYRKSSMDAIVSFFDQRLSSRL